MRTLFVPLTFVGAESAMIAHLVTVFSSNNPGDLRAETIRDEADGSVEDTDTRKLLDSSCTSCELYLKIFFFIFGHKKLYNRVNNATQLSIHYREGVRLCAYFIIYMY